MRNIPFVQQVLPHLIAVVVFFLVNFLFYSPVYLKNQQINQHDILQARGAAHEVVEYQEETGEPALWTNSMFGGMPAYLIGVKYSGDFVDVFLKSISLWQPHPARISLAAMICFYILLLSFGVRPYLAIAGALAYGLSTFQIISLEAGHNAKVYAMATMPLAFAGIHLAFRNKLLWGFMLTAVGMALQFRVNHLQITYYLLLLVLIYGISELIFSIREKRVLSLVKPIACLVLAVVLALGANISRIWTVFEYSQYSTRGSSDLVSDGTDSGLDRDYVFQWSNGVSESFTLIVPYFKGGASQQELPDDSQLGKTLRRNNIPRTQIKQNLKRVPTYFGDQPFVAGPIYGGALLAFLFMLGVLVADNRFRWWILAVFVLGLFLSWGKNFPAFNYFMYDYFPGYGKFRSVSMTLAMVLFAMPLLGFIGLEKLISGKFGKKEQRLLFIALGVTGGLTLVFFLFSGFGSYRGAVDAQLPDWYADALRSDREAMFRGDSIRSTLFILLGAAGLFALLKNRISLSLFAGLLTLLMLVDLWMVDRRYINNENFQRNPERAYFKATEADQLIMDRNTGGQRVLNLANPWNEAKTSFHHHSVGGYHGAKMGRYQELINDVLSPEIDEMISRLQNGSTQFSDLTGLNMLDTRFLMAGETAGAVIENTSAQGNAWLVSNVKKVNNANEELAEIRGINGKTTAVVDVSRFELSQDSFNSAGTITQTSFSPNEVRYTANLQGKALAVFSEIYYPVGWNVTVDGEPANILRANYVLRALELEPGQHEIRFSFEPKSYVVGSTIQRIMSILLLLVVLGTLGLGIRSFIHQSKEPSETS